MPTVVIIHAGEDTLPARALAEKLRAAKLTPVLEQTSSEALREAVKTAPVAIALWSPRSVAHAALAEEVSFARGKTKLLHAVMQNAAAPDQFRSDKIVNLTGWRGEEDFPAWRELAKLVTERAGVKPLPPPAPKPPSGFFQPGVMREGASAAAPAQARGGRAAQPQQHRAAAAPQPPRTPMRAPPTQSAPRTPPPEREAKSGGGRGMLIGIIAFIVVAGLGAGGYYFWNQSESAQSTSAAWDGVDGNDADALRAFISGDPGDYRDEAQQALAELEERSFEAASDADTIEGFEGFLNDFPDSEHAIAARGRIAELQTMTPPTEDETTGVLPPEGATTTDPDLVPPGTATAPAPDAGPAPLTPPVEQTPAPDPNAPTN
jgi:hypothetical protein